MNIEVDELCCHTAYVSQISEEEIENFPIHNGCPTCDARDRAPATLASLGGADWQHTLDIVLCRACGAVYYLNPPSPEDTIKFYRSEWGTRSRKEQATRINDSPPVNPKIANLLKDLAIEKTDCRILDVGCGLGGAMAALKSAGFENVFGLELSEFRAKSAGKRFAGRVFSQPFQDHNPDQNYDIIYCNHVLEHIYRPIDFFQWAVSNLSESGLIIVVVPDGEWEQVANQLLFLPHLHSFFPSSFARVADLKRLNLSFWLKSPRRDDLCAVFSKGSLAKLIKHDEAFCLANDYPSIAQGSVESRFNVFWDGARNADDSVVLNWSNANRLKDIKSSKQRWESHTKWEAPAQIFFRLLFQRRRLAEKYWHSLKRGERQIEKATLRFFSRQVTDYNFLTYRGVESGEQGVPRISFRGHAPILLK